MLTPEENERLTRVGPGTPMGELFRRYWQPVAACADLVDDPVKQVRILGETLVLFRDRSGQLGLIGERCPHRGTALVYGIPEPEGLRCAYHGWLYDRQGQCVQQPDRDGESSNGGAARYSITAYPVEELGGLVFAYLGPQPAPLLLRWEPLVEAGPLRSIGSLVVPCNWLQCMENGLDESHVEWLHGYSGNYIRERQGRREDQRPVRPHATFEFKVYEFGLLRGHAGTDDPPTPIIFPNITGADSLLIRVPIDDTHTLAIQYRVHRFPAEVEAPVQDVVPVYHPPLPGIDEDGRVTWPIMDVFGMHDMVMWHARGPIVDRSTEELDESDRGMVLHRRLLQENIDAVQRGEDPLGIIRDPARNVCVRLTGDAYTGQRQRAAQNFGNPADRYDPVVAQVRELLAEPG